MATETNDGSSNATQRRQGIYWLLTIPKEDWTPVLPDRWAYVKGQLERGETTAYEHWQVLAIAKRKQSLRQVKSVFGSRVHAELSRSAAADSYVWKEATRVENSQVFSN